MNNRSNESVASNAAAFDRGLLVAKVTLAVRKRFVHQGRRNRQYGHWGVCSRGDCQPDACGRGAGAGAGTPAPRVSNGGYAWPKPLEAKALADEHPRNVDPAQ